MKDEHVIAAIDKISSNAGSGPDQASEQKWGQKTNI